jgi:hypothetical protein
MTYASLLLWDNALTDISYCVLLLCNVRAAIPDMIYVVIESGLSCYFRHHKRWLLICYFSFVLFSHHLISTTTRSSLCGWSHIGGSTYCLTKWLHSSEYGPERKFALWTNFVILQKRQSKWHFNEKMSSFN